eukprot:TRINITY_DN452_c0_g1_i1.p1 TRINITY_DN452_c0_g1~~TRINITY_DN452_c0_g1_i1.p1  ORF type:complete len:708 (+),score=158.75 TRINITY_DN452_c0_g1_i1:367-2490(+)
MTARQIQPAKAALFPAPQPRRALYQQAPSGRDSTKLNPTPVPEEPQQERPVSKVVTFKGCAEDDTTGHRSSSAPVSGFSSTGGLLSDAEEDHAKNYGRDGYCRIVKGDTFGDGRYTALHQLGEGKYSTVWLMYDRDGPYSDFSNFVAVKVGRALASTILPEDIKREANLLEYVNTTHGATDLRYLATVIGSFVHQGPHGLHACMVFKVLGSQLLRLVCERNDAHRAGLPLDLAGVINIFKCILRGTAGFHRHHIVHTDLKPENILLAIPDPEVVEHMRSFAKERGLPEPYLEHRARVSVTPHHPGIHAGPSPGTSAPRRSDSVDPLDFWSGRSPPAPAELREADELASAQTMGRSTMACGGYEDTCALPSVSSMSATDFTAIEASRPTAVPAVLLGCPTPPHPPVPPGLPSGFVCSTRGAAAPVADSPLGEMDSPPPHTALHKTPCKETPPPTYRDDGSAEEPKDALQPQTPAGDGRKVHPGTPQFILEQGRGTDVLISDFGLAMVLEHAHALAPPGVHIYPQDCVVMNHNHGMVIQTREYRAPEVLLGQDFNVKIDIYSIACIMIELITGEYIWDPKNTVLKRHSRSEQEIDREHLQHMIAVMGTDEFPALRARRTCFKTRFFLANGDPRIPPNRRRKPKSRPICSILAPHVPEPMRSELAFVLGKMLEFHPNDRWSATQCLDYLDLPVFAPSPAPARVLRSSAAH